MLLRQLPAACCRSAGVRLNSTSFSASAKVAAETGGPTSGAVPNAGGVPGGKAAVSEVGPGLPQEAAAATNPAEAQLRKSRRELDMTHCNGRQAGGPAAPEGYRKIEGAPA